MLADAEDGYLKHIAFVVPSGSSWPLPLYELALMTAAEVRGMGIDDVQVSLISTEPAPLRIFGTGASDTVAALLGRRGHRVHRRLPRSSRRPAAAAEPERP